MFKLWFHIKLAFIFGCWWLSLFYDSVKGSKELNSTFCFCSTTFSICYNPLLAYNSKKAAPEIALVTWRYTWEEFISYDVEIWDGNTGKWNASSRMLHCDTRLVTRVVGWWLLPFQFVRISCRRKLNENLAFKMSWHMYKICSKHKE